MGKLFVGAKLEQELDFPQRSQYLDCGEMSSSGDFRTQASRRSPKKLAS